MHLALLGLLSLLASPDAGVPDEPQPLPSVVLLPVGGARWFAAPGFVRTPGSGSCAAVRSLGGGGVEFRWGYAGASVERLYFSDDRRVDVQVCCEGEPTAKLAERKRAVEAALAGTGVVVCQAASELWLMGEARGDAELAKVRKWAADHPKVDAVGPLKEALSTRRPVVPATR
jgi:hypothetical protein